MTPKIFIPLVFMVIGFSARSILDIDHAAVVDADCLDEPCANPPCCNGDVNGDGNMDLSDAIYMLTYLFADGSEPLAIKCPGTIVSHELPATGQTIWYDEFGAVIDCK